MNLKRKQTPKIIIGIILLEDPQNFCQTFSLPARNSPTGVPLREQTAGRACPY